MISANNVKFNFSKSFELLFMSFSNCQGGLFELLHSSEIELLASSHQFSSLQISIKVATMFRVPFQYVLCIR